ncbi:MAG: hypothetical protein V7638_1627 [Acidobacteriota bacterium]|jgi:hypothetical protein
MSTSDTIEFIAYHQPALLDGEYKLVVQQQVQIDGKFGWGEDQWTKAPRTELQFAVAGPRFSIEPGLIQSQYPPANSIGRYYNVLPNIILNRTTLPWERTIDNSSASTTTNPKGWMALLLFDNKADGGAPVVTNLKLQDLLDTYGQSATPANQPEFVKMLPREAQGQPGQGELKLEVGQHVNDRLTVIDVPKQLLLQIMPDVDELAFLSHIRVGQDSLDPAQTAEYPVILCNRLPAPGAGGVGTQSTVHLVSLEARKPLLDALKAKPQDNNFVRLVSLASWSFSTLQADKTFSSWIKEAWCPDAQRTDGTTSTCSAGVIHTLRMPVNSNPDAERFVSQGYVPIKHQTRQGNHIVSWYRSPFLPGPGSAADLALPVRTSDQLLRYLNDVGMFDTTYAAAWELGRMLTLRSKKVSVLLFNWKRAQAQQQRQDASTVTHLPFAPDYSIAPAFPVDVTQWFDDLLSLSHVPFHYLVPREEMLPTNSLRFFYLDQNWLECLLDGAFSVGRVSSADISQDDEARKAGRVPTAKTCSGFLLRSPVVGGWPHLGVEAYTEGVATPAKRLRFDRVGEDVLLCVFEGVIQTIDIHEHPDTIHFGVDPGDDPSILTKYTKALRILKGQNAGDLGPPVPLGWKSTDKRTLNILDLAGKGTAQNSAEFGVTMIEGAEKVRFIKS